MRRVSAIMLASVLATLGSVGCGSDACEDAAAKLESCGAEVGEPKTGTDCDGESECVAECFLDYGKCEDLDGTLAEADPDWLDCHLGCVGDPDP